MHRSRLVIGIAVVAFLLVGGCSGPDDVQGATTPTATTPPSPSASPSPSPSPTPSPTSTREPEPEPGPGFERTDEVGAQAAAKYFVDVITYTMRTADESALDRIEWPKTCRFCASVRRVMQERHNEAAVTEGGDTTVEILKTYAFDEFGGGYPLDIRITQEDARLLDAQGNLVRDDPGSTSDYRIELLHDDTTWRLVNILSLEDIE